MPVRTLLVFLCCIPFKYWYYRSPFDTLRTPAVIITDKHEKIVYRVRNGTTEHAMLWVWRELLLSSILHRQDDTLAKHLVADIQNLGLAKKMFERLRNEISRMYTGAWLAVLH